MNYQIRLVVGEASSFFLSEWSPGGVEITEKTIGLFGATATTDEWTDELDMYGLSPVHFPLADLLKIGLSRQWVWKKVLWRQSGQPTNAVLGEADRRLKDVLGPGLAEDQQRQIALLKLVQAVSRREGDPVGVAGKVKGVGGRPDVITVFGTGVIAYERTPHPIPFLRVTAGVAEERLSSV